MRKILLGTALLVFIGLGTASVGGPEGDEGEMTIMESGGSASATTSVGPNGTRWRTDISNTGTSCISGNQTQNVSFGDFQDVEEGMTKISFHGGIKTSNPCHEISLNVSETSEDSYRVELVEKSTNSPTEVCESCLGLVRFNASFSAPGDYRVEFVNQGETLEELETSGYGSSSSETGQDDDSGLEGASVMEAISNWLSWLGL